MDYNLLYLEYANLMMSYIPIQRFSSLNNITYFNGKLGGGGRGCVFQVQSGILLIGWTHMLA